MDTSAGVLGRGTEANGPGHRRATRLGHEADGHEHGRGMDAHPGAGMSPSRIGPLAEQGDLGGSCNILRIFPLHRIWAVPLFS